jgi:hypothetical protein
MSLCRLTAGIDVSCDSLRKPGGLFREAWAFNISDLTAPLPVTVEDYITNIPLSTYRTLYKFAGTKYSHEATWTEQTSDGGNKSYQQSVTLRLFNDTPTADAAIENLGVAEVGIIVKTNAGEFLIYGAENGLTSDGSTGGAGRQATDSTTSTIILVGTERFLPKRLLIGGSATTTQAYLTAATAG